MAVWQSAAAHRRLATPPPRQMSTSVSRVTQQAFLNPLGVGTGRFTEFALHWKSHGLCECGGSYHFARFRGLAPAPACGIRLPVRPSSLPHAHSLLANQKGATAFFCSFVEIFCKDNNHNKVSGFGSLLLRLRSWRRENAALDAQLLQQVLRLLQRLPLLQKNCAGIQGSILGAAQHLLLCTCCCAPPTLLPIPRELTSAPSASSSSQAPLTAWPSGVLELRAAR